MKNPLFFGKFFPKSEDALNLYLTKASTIFNGFQKKREKRVIELDSWAVSSGLIPLFSPLIIRVFLIKNFQIRFPMVFGTCLRLRQSCFF
ncbi:hypothetical protein BpHYR1_004941 [Brachionus plicatilis]|uniref:Uncharacterized protein n=1 Tax=Brachionus plicatilis TaxID=10195 RepID=A0A3M7S147_BRAPC|nr:hypothetical protein BpHYR1_004941 [Brachionus plicatilis]